MFEKISKLYQNAILTTDEPDLSSADDHYWFYDYVKKQWLGIPHEGIVEKELLLLKAILQYYEPSKRNNLTQAWFNYLFSGGEPPLGAEETRYRIVQFYCKGNELTQQDFHDALEGFFPKNALFLWENDNQGLIVEKECDAHLGEEEFKSIANTFENDFYEKISFYLGKLHKKNSQLSKIFRFEKNCFLQGLELLPAERALTFEKIFPYWLMGGLSDDSCKALVYNVLEDVKDDKELLTTVRIFIENNMNASVTAKKLYIHRNTLQYRLERFAEKTGIVLKDFHAVFTVYAACLINMEGL